MPLELTTAQIKEVLHCTTGQMATWREKGFPAPRKQGKAWMYPARHCVQWAIAQERYRAQGGNEDTNVVSLDEARSRQAMASAVKTEIDIAVRRGDLAEIATLERPLAEVAQTLVSHCDTFPGRLKVLMPHLTDEDHRTIREELARWRNEVYEQVTSWPNR